MEGVCNLSKLYKKWSAELRELFGGRVQKLSLDLGAGCPNRESLTHGGCIFCDAGGGGTGAWIAGVSLEEQINRGIKGAIGHYKASCGILYFQSYSSTYLPLNVFISRVEEAIRVAKDKFPIVGISVGTRPDLVPDPVLDYLSSLVDRGFMVWLELGVQTTDESGLVWLNRQHTVGDVEDALNRCAGRSFRVSAHLIAGIKGEVEEQLLYSARWLLDRGVTGLKFHPLHVLRGTALEKMYLNGEYTPLELEEYTDRVSQVLRLEGRRFVVQRLAAYARPPRLVAPDWINDKNRVMGCIDAMIDI